MIVLVHVYNGYICLLRSHQIDWYKSFVSLVLFFCVSACICTNFFEHKFVVSRYVVLVHCWSDHLFNSSFTSHMYHLNSAFSHIDGKGHTNRASEFLIFDLFLLMQMDWSGDCDNSAWCSAAQGFKLPVFAIQLWLYLVLMCTLCGYISTLNLHCIIVIFAADCLLLFTVLRVELFCIVFRYRNLCL